MVCITNITSMFYYFLLFFVVFMKELNDLVQMLISIGESIPRRDRQPNLAQTSGISDGSTGGLSAVQGKNLSLISLLESCQFSLAGIVVTVSTPLATAIRFSTGKIEMTLTNTSSQNWKWFGVLSSAEHQLSLDGRVDIDINLALGYLQAVGPDVVDDLCELAYFRTKVSVRNTLQNLYSTDERIGQVRGHVDGGEKGTAVDTFLITISSPHLYLQSSAVEQGDSTPSSISTCTCASLGQCVDSGWIWFVLFCSNSLLAQLQKCV